MKTYKNLHELIFFVTSRCNSRCRHCFNWKNLNKKTDLDLRQISLLIQKMPPINNLLLSGGEPFLRTDLPELINLFIQHNQIKTVSIPTNGLLTENILTTLKKILMLKNLKTVNINFSLDGLAETHNKIRGIENNFQITLETIKEVDKLKETHKNLNLLINSVVLEENRQQLLKLTDLISSQAQINGHFFEIIRPLGPDNFNKLKFPFSFYQTLLEKQYDYFKKQIKTKNILKRFIKKIFFLGHQFLIYKTQYNNYFFQKNWPINCSAGKNIIVLNDEGLINVCELRSKQFNLMNYSSWRELNQSVEYQEELKRIKKEKCFCTHSCFLDASFNFQPKFKYLHYSFYGLINYCYYEIIHRHS